MAVEGRRAIVIASVAVLVLGGAVLASRHLSKRSNGNAVASAEVETVGAFTARHYAQPLVSVSDLEISEEGGSEDEADAAVSGFKPRDDRPAWKLEPPIDWAANPFKDRNWQFQLHALAMTKPLLASYAKSGDSARYRQVLAFTLDWWRYHTSKKATDFSWYDMATGLRASLLAYLLDRAFIGKEKLSSDELNALLAMSRAHVQHLTNPKFMVMTNHGLFQIQGLVSLCKVLGEVDLCVGADAFVQKQLTKLLDAQFDQYGVHREHSPQYHRLAMEAMARFAQPNGSGVYKQVADRLQLAHAVFPWLVFPGGRLAALGDTEGEAPNEPAPEVQKCKAATATSCAEVGDFSRSGYVVVRSPWARPNKEAFMLILTGMNNRGTYKRLGDLAFGTHKHVDDLSFELMERGELLFEDTGKYAYLNDDMYKFVHNARAHSTVGLGDREIVRTDTKPYGSALQEPQLDGDVHVLRGKVERKNLFTHARRIDYAPGRYLLIDDELTSTEKRVYESYLHLAPQLQAQSAHGGFIATLADGRSMRIESVSSDCKASQARGQEKPLQGWVTKAYREMTPASALTFACEGKDRHITLLVSFDEKARAEGLARATRGLASN